MQEGMPLVTVTDLEVNDVDRLLIAGTFGRGAWTWPLDALSTDVDEAMALPARVELDGTFPNPFREQLNVAWRQPESAPVSLRIVDMNGRTVHEVDLGQRAAGRQTWSWSSTGLAAGTYMLLVQAGRNTAQQPVIHLR